MITISEAREIIAKLAEKEGEFKFAREVRSGVWDHRNDVQSALAGTFKPRLLKIRKQA